MAHVDDWGSTEPSERRRLEAPCADPLCGSPRYAHGTIVSAPSNTRTVQYTSGPCSVRPCEGNCQEFKEKPPITRDEVMDLAAFLKPETITLKDLGIDPAKECRAYVVQFADAESKSMKKAGYCRKDKNHEGPHEPVWSEEID